MVPTSPAAEVTLMIRPVPSSARNGRAAWLTVNVPPTWTSSTSWNCSAVIFGNIAGAITPALFTTTCKVPPVSSAACSAARAACAASRTSSTADSARPPAAAISSATAAAASLSASVTKTAAPAAASALATAAPMPLPAPVTSADRPAENHPVVAVAHRASQRDPAQAQRFRRDQHPLRVEAVQDVPEALPLLTDPVRLGHAQVVDEQLVRADRIAAHLPDRPDVNVVPVQVGEKERQPVRLLLDVL